MRRRANSQPASGSRCETGSTIPWPQEPVQQELGRRPLAWGWRLLLTLVLLVLARDHTPAQTQTVNNSLHNLSPSASGVSTVCVYCHAPHHNAPVKGLTGLWNHQLATSTYTLYSNSVSSTYQESAASLSPVSPSRLCLSCHDGTVAIGATYSSGTLSTSTSLTAGANLGVDLSTSHPFSFDTWVQDNDMLSSLLTTPRTTANPNVKLPNGRIECNTCHEPHQQNLDPIRQEFLSANNASSALCLDCHDVNSTSSVLYGWTNDPHATDTASNYGSVGGYSTVAQSACMSCHVPHGSGASPLLRGTTPCTPCHCDLYGNCSEPPGGPFHVQGSSRQANILAAQTDPTKFAHPFAPAPQNVSVTNNVAVPRKVKDQASSGGTSREATCWDCHSAHQGVSTSATVTRSLAGRLGRSSIAVTRANPSSGGTLAPALVAVSGVDKNGNHLKVVSHEYEICFKCHANSSTQPQKAPGNNIYGYVPARQVDASNVRLDFTSLSHHNVVNPRSSASVPDLRPAVLQLDGGIGKSLSSGYLNCTDCHNGNDAQEAGGKGSNGPHISDFAHLLERRYDMNRPAPDLAFPVTSLSVPPDGGDSLSGPFALCNKCHNLRQLLTSGDSVFRHHASHVVAGGISCAVCHAPHGVQGNDPARHAELINLDMSMVGPDPTTGRLEINTAARTCYVSCHFSNAPAKVHSGTRY